MSPLCSLIFGVFPGDNNRTDQRVCTMWIVGRRLQTIPMLGGDNALSTCAKKHEMSGLTVILSACVLR